MRSGFFSITILLAHRKVPRKYGILIILPDKNLKKNLAP